MKTNYLVQLGNACLLSLACTCALGADNRMGGNGIDIPEWVEEAVPPPPAFSADHLIALEMPAHLSVKMGVDPKTISVGGDGVVRYVIVMRNTTGSTSAVYEGIRCATDEVKTYARQSSSGEWSAVTAPQWKAVNDNMPSRHAHAFARQGGCIDRLATSPQQIIKALNFGRKPS
jgi:hypothetical protein